MKVKVSKSQVASAVALAGGVATTIYTYTNGQHLPSWLAWVPGVAVLIASLSRSVLPTLSGVPGQQPGVLPKPEPKVELKGLG